MVKKQLTDKEKEVLLEIGTRIKKARENIKMSQSQLAKDSGIDRSFLSQIEKGEVNFSYLKLYKIIQGLNNADIIEALQKAKKN